MNSAVEARAARAARTAKRHQPVAEIFADRRNFFTLSLRYARLRREQKLRHDLKQLRLRQKGYQRIPFMRLEKHLPVSYRGWNANLQHTRIRA